MAALTVQNIALAGITPSLTAAAEAGDTFINDGNTYFQVKNASGAEITVTFTTAGTFRGVALENPTVTVAATTGDKLVGPFDKEAFNNSTGSVAITYSAFASVTVGAFKLG